MQYIDFDKIYFESDAVKNKVSDGQIDENNAVLIITPFVNTLRTFHSTMWDQATSQFPDVVFVEDYEHINEMNKKDLVHMLICQTKDEAKQIVDELNTLSNSILALNISRLLSDVSEQDIELLKNGKWTIF